MKSYKAIFEEADIKPYKREIKFLKDFEKIWKESPVKMEEKIQMLTNAFIMISERMDNLDEYLAFIKDRVTQIKKKK